MAWRLERHDEYMPEDWGVEPIRLVDDEGETVADNVAFYPHALTREHADAILAMQARLASPSPSPAPGVVEALREAKKRFIAIENCIARNLFHQQEKIKDAQSIATDGWSALDVALASLSQPAKGERVVEALPLEEIRRRVRNIWGAISSDQVIDKDVEGQAKRLLADIDAALSALAHPVQPGWLKQARLIVEDVSNIQYPTRLSSRTVERLVFDARKEIHGDGNCAAPQPKGE